MLGDTDFQVLWFHPLTVTVQRQVMVLGEVLYAWSCMEVFLVAIAAACLELPTFALFIIGSRCTEINQILEVCCDGLLHHDDQCFDVDTTLLSPGYTYPHTPLSLSLSRALLYVCMYACVVYLNAFRLGDTPACINRVYTR